MKKIVKRFISIFICIIISVSCTYTAFAAEKDFTPLSLSAGMANLRGQFHRTERGPKVSGFSIDYSYFSPKKNSKDKTKYPLVICMGGAGSGSYEGKELDGNYFAYWSSKEYQELFSGSKGAYILMARAPEPIYWDTAPMASLEAALNDFIERKENINNIDTSRIYVIGWCIGCCGAVRLAKDTDWKYQVAGMILHAPRHFLTISEAVKFKDKAVWIVGCIFDPYSIYWLYTLPAWGLLKATTNNKLSLRLTHCTYAPYSKPLPLHRVWDYTASNMTNPWGCKNLKTINGLGDEIPNPSVISWLSSFKTSK